MKAPSWGVMGASAMKIAASSEVVYTGRTVFTVSVFVLDSSSALSSIVSSSSALVTFSYVIDILSLDWTKSGCWRCLGRHCFITDSGCCTIGLDGSVKAEVFAMSEMDTNAAVAMVLFLLENEAMFYVLLLIINLNLCPTKECTEE